MVIQVISAPMEAASGNADECKKYIVVKNHVREISNNSNEANTNEETVHRKKNCKLPKKQKLSQNEDQNKRDVSTADLEELKSVYKKAKTVLRKIESRYGHLLDLNDESCSSSSNDKNVRQYECHCLKNKKTVFTDDGKPIPVTEYDSEGHVCPKKLNRNERYSKKSQSIQIEHENLYEILPESIQELNEILKDPTIKVNLRNRVIERIKYMRQENLNIIRFDKQSIIQKMKSNPEELIDFQGSNVSSLMGYPTKK